MSNLEPSSFSLVYVYDNHSYYYNMLTALLIGHLPTTFALSEDFDEPAQARICKFPMAVLQVFPVVTSKELVKF